MVSINNLVCTWYIGHDNLDLWEMSARAPFLTYDPLRFAAAICHMQSPKATCLLFNTGRGVCAGTKSRECALLAVTQLVSMIQRAGFFYGRVRDFKVRNLVASSRCDFTIDLQKMCSSISSHCTYHAGLFPGLRFKPGIDGNKRQALLLYRNGGVVITGNSSIEECKALWNKAYKIVLRYATEMPVGQENSAEYRVRVKASSDAEAVRSDIVAQSNQQQDTEDQGISVERECTIELSSNCRMTTRQLIRGRGAGDERVASEFSVASTHERALKRCRASVRANVTLQ